MIRRTLFAAFLAMGLAASPPVHGEPPTKAKFYDFSDQIINGEIRKPTNLYLDARKKVKFDRLLKLKKSFIPELLKTAKDPVFK